MKYIVGDLELDDLEQLKELYDSSFDKESNLDIMRSKFLDLITSKNTKMITIKTDKLIGFIKCDIIDDFVGIGKPYLYLSNLCVDKSYRGLNYGSILLDEAFKFANDNNCEYVFLTCGEQRICASNLYKKHGYNIKSSNIFQKYL